ncbi:GNAT family N-acetyltransferase [Pararhizobium mangrovi]|nr:GNAT family N-acetyltransferase [Pararhizobium mangrovi]
MTLHSYRFIAACEERFDFRSAEYRALFEASGANAFQHPIWLAQLHERLVGDGACEAVTITVRHRRDGTLALVLPMVRRRAGGMKLVEFADMRVTDYAAAVCDRETLKSIADDEEIHRAIRAELKPFDVLRIAKLHECTADDLCRILDAGSLRRMKTSAYACELPGNFDAWRDAKMRRSFRRDLDKKTRQLHRRGATTFETVRDGEEIARTLEAMRAFRASRFRSEEQAAGDLLRSRDHREFYLAVAREGAAQYARMYRICVDGRIVACAMGLSHAGALLVVLIGFDQAEFGRQSVGSLLFQHIGRDCIERGDRLLDFTIGDEAYKSYFGAEQRPLFTLSKVRTPTGLIADVATERLPFVKEWARSVLDH